MKLVVCIVLASLVTVLFALSPGCSHIKWKSISQGGSGHTIAIHEDGTLWAWGDNRDFQIGDGTSNISVSPKQIGSETNWKTVSVGLYHSLAIKEDGSLWGWGNNDFGQIGPFNASKKVSIPVKISNETGWNAVEGGDWHTIALKNDGTLWGTGKNYDGQLGIDTQKKNISTLTAIGTDKDWLKVSLGFGFTLALKSNGSLYGFGKNEKYQIGTNTTSRDISVPTLISGNSTWVNISAGLHGSAGIQTDGTLWIWGCAYFKDCKDLLKEPTKFTNDTNWKTIVMTDYAGLALKADGTFWGWGSNYYGQIGRGAIGNYTKDIVQIGQDNDWDLIRAGQTFTIGLKKSGQFLIWGGNSWGQLGFGYRKDYDKYGSPAACGSGTGCLNKVCSRCPALHVLNGFNCEQCAMNQWIKGSQCLNCSDNCGTCSGNASTCTSCTNTNFLTVNNTCEKCHAACLTCVGNATTCTACADNSTVLTADGRCLELGGSTISGSGIPTWFIILVVVNVILAGLIGYMVGFKRAQKDLLSDHLTDKELEL